MLDEEDSKSEILVANLSYRKRLQSVKTSSINHERAPKKYNEKEKQYCFVCLGRNPPNQASHHKKPAHGVEKIQPMQVWKKKEYNLLKGSRSLDPLH